MTSGDFSDHNPKIGRDMVSNTLANPQHSVNTFRPSRFERMDALEYLKVDCGAALIPVADPANGLKFPADGFRQWPRWRSWQWQDLKGHAQRDGQFAIIPSSIGCAAADWDSPDMEALIAFSKDYSDALDLPTQRGYHFYFPNIDHFNPTKFTYHGVERGEAISRNSYAIMWSTAPQQFAAFVQNGYVRRRQPALFPLDLLKNLERLRLRAAASRRYAAHTGRRDTASNRHMGGSRSRSAQHHGFRRTEVSGLWQREKLRIVANV